MLKNNKLKVLISSVIILLPTVFGFVVWNKLPDSMTTHWGTDGNADGLASKVFVVFGLPIILLLLHIVCLFLTSLDDKQKQQNKKALGMIFWIFPVISFMTNGVIYSLALEKKINLSLIITATLGVMLVFIGNYLPKIKQNRTLGIKLFWTLNNEENWNRTHRFGGKLWVICGFALMLCSFLPGNAFIIATICIIAVLAILPAIYSYTVYDKHKKQGVIYGVKPAGKAEKLAVRISTVLVPAIVIGVVVLMFTGEIKVVFEAETIQINASYWSNTTVAYSEIDSVEYRNDLDIGVRTNGFASARLSMGIFENGEFGTYTLYSYTDAREFIVLTSDEKTLVIGMSDTEETAEAYNEILNKIGG